MVGDFNTIEGAFHFDIADSINERNKRRRLSEFCQPIENRERVQPRRWKALERIRLGLSNQLNCPCEHSLRIALEVLPIPRINAPDLGVF